MADPVSWWAERAEQLAGTPFAKPPGDPLDATRPMIAVAPAGQSPKRVNVDPPRSRSRITFPGVAVIVAMIAVIAAVALWGRLKSRTSPLPRSAVVAALPVPMPAIVPPPPTSPLAPTSTTPIEAVPPTASTSPPAVAQFRTPPTVRGGLPRKSGHGRGTADQHRTAPARHARPEHTDSTPSRAGERSPGGANPSQKAVKSAALLPICQPQITTRPPRPCRPSHKRHVREPFYSE